MSEYAAIKTVAPATHCRSNPVSGRHLLRREYLKCPPETVGDFASELGELGVWRQPVNKPPRLPPPSLDRSKAWLANRRRDPTPINSPGHPCSQAARPRRGWACGVGLDRGGCFLRRGLARAEAVVGSTSASRTHRTATQTHGRLQCSAARKVSSKDAELPDASCPKVCN
jgi:hypothetical protein